MTPTRTTSNPLSARVAAAAAPNPSAAGVYGGRLLTMLSPCRITTRPWVSVIQRPAGPNGPREAGAGERAEAPAAERADAPAGEPAPEASAAADSAASVVPSARHVRCLRHVTAASPWPGGSEPRPGLAPSIHPPPAANPA